MAWRHQAASYTWAIVDPVLYHHMSSLSHNNRIQKCSYEITLIIAIYHSYIDIYQSWNSALIICWWLIQKKCGFLPLYQGTYHDNSYCLELYITHPCGIFPVVYSQRTIETTLIIDWSGNQIQRYLCFTCINLGFTSNLLWAVVLKKYWAKFEKLDPYQGHWHSILCDLLGFFVTTSLIGWAQA